MQPTSKHQLITLEAQAIQQAMAEDNHLLNGLRKVFAFQRELADESCRNEALGEARTHIVSQWASRARMFAEMERIIKDTAARLAPQLRS